MKLYKAIVSVQGSDERGVRVSVRAASLREAREALEAQYGEGTVFDLHNEDDAERPR